jgi:hypothetical protein
MTPRISDKDLLNLILLGGTPLMRLAIGAIGLLSGLVLVSLVSLGCSSVSPPVAAIQKESQISDETKSPALNEPVRGKDLIITVLSASNEGKSFSESMPGVQAQTITSQSGTAYLFRVKILIEWLNKGSGEIWSNKEILVQLVVRDGAGKSYKYFAAGVRGGYMDLTRTGQRQMITRPVGQNAEIDYIFRIPDGVVITDFVWPDLPPVRLR